MKPRGDTLASYGTLAERHNVSIPLVYRIHHGKLEKMKVEGAKDTLEALEEFISGLLS